MTSTIADMKNATVHVPRGRRYPGEWEALPLIRFLNRPDEVAIKRLSALIGAFQELDQLDPIGRRKKFGNLEEYQRVIEISSTIGETLGAYRLRPRVVLPGKGKNWSIQWVSGGDLGCAPDNFASPFTEGDAVLLVLSLAQRIERGRRLIDKPRRCKRCERWLFARFKRHLYCSKKCQQAFYRSSPEWKRKRKKQKAAAEKDAQRREADWLRRVGRPRPRYQ